MTMTRRATPLLALLAAFLMIAGLTAPNASQAADHLDAPGILPPGGDIQADINDLYAFAGATGNTVLAVTVHPAANSLSTFGSDVLYQIKIDTNGDAVEDISYKFSFSAPTSAGAQSVYVRKAIGADAVGHKPTSGVFVAFGPVESILSMAGGGQLYTGLRSDPFFFDFNAFLGTVEGVPTGASLLDGTGSDFFAPLDVLAMVLEVPDSALANGNPIGVWTTTAKNDGSGFAQVDRTGRPGINTVVNSTGPLVQAPEGAKTAFNQAAPVNDEQFRARVVSALKAYSSLDTEGAYTDAQANALADVLLPDILPFDKNQTALPPPLEGRALADDVIDTELRVMTGGDPLGLFADRDANGAINTDLVGPHDDYLSSFPYLGTPHAMVEANYKITIENLTNGQPFSPPVVATHSSGFSMFTVGSAANNALAAIAQDGNPAPMVQAATGSAAVTDVSAGIPMGTQTKQVGPFARTQSFGLTASPGDVLSLATMLICTNDGFLGLDSVALPTSGSATFDLIGYDAGREQNTQLSDDIVQPCSLLGPTALPGDPDGNDNSNVESDVIRLHPGIQSTGELTPANHGWTNPVARVTVERLPALGARFTDDNGNVHEFNIEIIAAVGITIGCNPSGTAFCPGDPTTRGQMAAFLNRALNLPDTTQDFFADDNGSIFEEDINRLAAAGITFGTSATTFSPHGPVTRGQMAAFVARAWALPSTSQDFFTDDNGSVHEADINRLAAAGVTKGTGPGTFEPFRAQQRDEMASFLARVLGWGS